MPSFDGGVPSESSIPLASENTSGHPGSPPPGEFGTVPDVTVPTVTVVSPTAGTAIGATTVLVVDVEDDAELAIVLLYAEFPNRVGSEVIHNGTSFMAPYATNSTRSPTAQGYRYSLRRDGGWPGDVSLTAVPVDRGGNTST